MEDPRTTMNITVRDILVAIGEGLLLLAVLAALAFFAFFVL